MGVLAVFGLVCLVILGIGIMDFLLNHGKPGYWDLKP